jgi:hypothetical protein
VTINYTPFELAYGLQPNDAIEYLLPTTNSQRSKDFALVRVLTSIFSKLEKLDETR